MTSRHTTITVRLRSIRTNRKRCKPLPESFFPGLFCSDGYGCILEHTFRQLKRDPQASITLRSLFFHPLYFLKHLSRGATVNHSNQYSIYAGRHQYITGTFPHLSNVPHPDFSSKQEFKRRDRSGVDAVRGRLRCPGDLFPNDAVQGRLRCPAGQFPLDVDAMMGGACAVLLANSRMTRWLSPCMPCIGQSCATQTHHHTPYPFSTR